VWAIARRYNTSVQALKSLNGLKSDTIYPNQVLQLPGDKKQIMIRVLLTAMCFLLIMGCNESDQRYNTVLESKANSNPSVDAMLAEFRAQAHRIELNGCQLLYNDKPLHLGMSIRELQSVFGPYDFFNRGYYVWKGAGIAFLHNIGDPEDVDSVPTSFDFYLNLPVDITEDELMKHTSIGKRDYLLLQGAPVDAKMTVADFFNYSTFTLDDFAISTMTYEKDYQCTDKTLRYLIMARGGWLYKGTGHLQMKSHPNPNNTNKIRSLTVYIPEE